MMGGIKLTVTGDLVELLRSYGAEAEEAIEKAVAVTGLDVMGTARKSIQRGIKTGRTYQKYNPKRTHKASAPGEAPASDEGTLANSITYQTLSPLVAEVGTLLDYGRYLEYGTMNIAERPWLRPAVDINRAEFADRLRAALQSSR